MNEEEREIVKKFERLYLKDFNNEKITNEDRLSYIECVLMSNLIEKLQKENEKLKEVRKWYFENTINKICSPEMLNKILRDDYISKKEVKDKIEEEKLPLTIVGGRRNRKTLEYGIKLGRRQVLQELIEGKK